MRPDDVAAVEQVTDAAYQQVERRTRLPDDPPTRGRGRVASQQWRAKCAHLVEHDPGGCWVALDGAGALVGAALSIRRESLWVLSAFAVLPSAQNQGVGKALLAAALRYGEGCLRGMLASSADPRAVRLYREAGFTIHPSMRLSGTVRREALPVPEHVREGGRADLDLADSVDRRTRGAAHGVDHRLLLDTMAMLVVDRPTGSGYCYVGEAGPYLLAASNRRTATRLLWAALAASTVGGLVEVPRVTVENQWALDTGLAAGLSVRQAGYLALRHTRPPAAYLPSGTFL